MSSAVLFAKSSLHCWSVLLEYFNLAPPVLRLLSFFFSKKKKTREQLDCYQLSSFLVVH